MGLGSDFLCLAASWAGAEYGVSFLFQETGILLAPITVAGLLIRWGFRLMRHRPGPDR